jgi:type IV pilus assembly protein PilW
MSNDMNRHSASHPAFAGFTLVETMVAILIGMLVTFIVMQVYATSEGQKRTITGGADAQSDAAAILYLMERDLRQAGYGLSANPEDFNPGFTAPPTGVLTFGILAQCTNVRAYNKNRATTTDFVYANSTFAPVVINPTGYPAGDDKTDVVLVNYGASSGVIGKGVTFATQDTGGNVSSFVVSGAGSPDARAGFVQGDLVLAVPPPASGLDCTLGEVTGLPPAPPGPATCTVNTTSAGTIIDRNDAAYSSYYTGCAAGPNASAAWNKVGAPVVYSAGSKLYNLGPVSAFVSRVYAVREGNLTVCDLTKQDCTAAVADPPDPAVWTPIASGVVGLHAQYGRDTDFNGGVDVWDTTTAPPGVVAPAAHVVAVRLGLAVRSGQYEKDIVTTAAPVWHADAATTSDVNFDVSGATSNWQQYRYKTAQSIVPLRDMIWGQQNAN